MQNINMVLKLEKENSMLHYAHNTNREKCEWSVSSTNTTQRAQWKMGLEL